ncbi:heme exporter protein CcmD [Erwinia sp. OLTSP20]|uniref:heme exporter protein CcmD n=1 Tax=unclassified Erwinia TaxID=2622719 RepID=UPI000C1973FF|nr:MULTISPECIES: heme exporter protein CcmD [unclassified Erwinia]PIJ51536.1 heme exporter protein CcmD [Erwinia sp. OAMSP11]PIJ75878.1 heme exporter protein CcmD [Erwinia sp. OLSSP12]PIJ83446.1 heme exporter protein CcmD [Erwinia sp. OLCASP19]PIJ86279.1 heme exporter protein CcmD [Erwinia sp. OLMTSP26]PIJ88478.1 heme exporter protein CcmD [Erwinia sp. OLMDSP33]
MTPAFSSWQDFFAMGGYAFYVWLAVVLTLLPLLVLLVHTLLTRRFLLKEIQRKQQRARRIRNAKTKNSLPSATAGE